jgi:hypothetical protein
MRGSCSGAEIRDAHAGGYDDPVRGGCYLNIGEQHLFCSEGYFFYERHKRLSVHRLSWSSRVTSPASPPRWRPSLLLAAETAEGHRAAHASGDEALRRLA